MIRTVTSDVTKLNFAAAQSQPSVMAEAISEAHDPVVEKKELLSARIKEVIKDMLQCDEMPVTNISVHIAESLHLNYSYLSDVFSSVNGITIEHYIIRKRVEKGIMLLLDTSLDIGKIAERLCYKSCTHFSAQFRAVTGYTPSFFRKMHRRDAFVLPGS